MIKAFSIKAWEDYQSWQGNPAKMRKVAPGGVRCATRVGGVRET